MSLSYFKIHSATIEITFKNAYTIWDKVGQFWSKINERWPDMKMVDGSPITTHFTLDKETEISLELGKFRVTQYVGSNDLEKFEELCKDVIPLAQEIFNFGIYSRVGFRIISFRKFDSKEETAEQFLKFGLLKIPSKKHFNIEGKIINPSYGYRWEDEHYGINLKMDAVSNTLNFEPPINLLQEIEPVKIERNGIQLDVDYYSLKPIPHTKLSWKDWIGQTYQVIKRDLTFYVGG